MILGIAFAEVTRHLRTRYCLHHPVIFGSNFTQNILCWKPSVSTRSWCVAQIISFGIVYFVFGKFLYPNKDHLASTPRRESPRHSLIKATIETRLKEFDQEQKAAQKKAAEDIQKLIAEAKDSAAVTKKDLVAKAQEAANAEVAAAQKRIEQKRSTPRQRSLSTPKPLHSPSSSSSLREGCRCQMAGLASEGQH